MRERKRERDDFPSERECESEEEDVSLTNCRLVFMLTQIYTALDLNLLSSLSLSRVYIHYSSG